MVGGANLSKGELRRSRLKGRKREYPNGTTIEMGFYIFSFTHGVTPY